MQGDMQRRLGGWLGNLVLIATVGGCGLFWTSQGGGGMPVELVDEESRLLVEDTVDTEASAVTLPDPGPFTIETPSVDGGTARVEPRSTLYGRDDFVVITALPTPGSRFVGWSGDLAGGSNPTTVNMSADLVVTPMFTSDAAVTVQAIGEGQVIADVSLDDTSIGDSITFTAIPAEGRVLQSWITDPAVAPGWWSTEWDYRLPLAITTVSAQTDALASVTVDFGAALDSLGEDGAFDPGSIRVIEVDADGAIVAPIVPFEYQPDPTDDTTGTLRVVLAGDSLAGQTRGFHVYFDTIFGGHVPVASASRVTLTEGDVWNTLPVSRIDAGSTTYYFDPIGGGLAGMVDGEGNDWISWNPTDGADGRLRGIPNAVLPEGLMQPGGQGSATTVTWAGPLTTELTVDTAGGAFRSVWRFSEHGVSVTVDTIARPYWFLYQGTPGGSLDLDTDVVVRSTGEVTSARTAWTGDLAGTEWLAVADPGLGRSILLTSHQDDTATDSYDAAGAMTALGFGRSGSDAQLSTVPATFSVALVESAEVADLGAVAADMLGVTLGAIVGQAETFDTGLVADPSITITLTGDVSVQAVFETG